MINKLLLVGTIDGAPELIHPGTERSRLAFSIKTAEVRKDKEGKMKSLADWHRVVLFGRAADLAGQKLKKGLWVMVEGKLQSNRWEDKNGNKHNGYQVLANSILPLSMEEAGSGDDKGGEYIAAES